MLARTRLNDEDGVAMIVAMAVLLAIALLATGLGTTAQQANSLTVRDSSSKRALAAAEAGLQVATQRYAAYRSSLTSSTSCLAGTDGVTVQTATGSECPSFPVAGDSVGGDLGDGASYSYVISLPDTGCPAAPVDPTTATAGDRCITSTGTVQGVQRRLQMRVGQTVAPSYFSFDGLVGLDSLEFINSVEIDSDVGSNGTITIGSATVNGDAYLGPGGSVDPESRVRGDIIQKTEPFVLEPSDEFDVAKLTNHNALLSQLPSSRYNASTGAFTPGSDTLPVAPTGTTTYYFCSIFMNSGNLKVPAGRKVRIFVDSPTRPGSLCTSGGSVTFNDSVSVNSDGPPTALEFYLAGCNPGPCARPSSKCSTTYPADLRFCNSVEPVNALFYAPSSYAFLDNSIEVNGALGAKSVVVNNSVDFSFPAEGLEEGAGEGETVSTGWFECNPEPSDPADPESGC